MTYDPLIWLKVTSRALPVLHSLSSERVQNFTKISGVDSKSIFFQIIKNNVILAFISLILRLSGSENFSGLNALNRLDNITGLNDL